MRACGFGLVKNGLHVGQHGAAQLGQVRLIALPVKERAAEFGLEPLDGARQGGLRHIAGLRRTREI